MFKRLIILESDKHSIWIKLVGGFLITLRFADWPYELAFRTLQQQIMSQSIESGSNCLAQWYVSYLFLILQYTIYLHSIIIGEPVSLY